MGIGISPVNTNSITARNASVSFGSRLEDLSLRERYAIEDAFEHRFDIPLASGGTEARSLDDMFELSKSALEEADDRLSMRRFGSGDRLRQTIWNKIGGKGRYPEGTSLDNISEVLFSRHDVYGVEEYTHPKLVKACVDAGIPVETVSEDSGYAKFLAELDKEIKVQKQEVRSAWVNNENRYMLRKWEGVELPARDSVGMDRFIEREMNKLYRLKESIVKGTRAELADANKILVKMYKNSHPALSPKEIMQRLSNILFKVK